MKIWHQDAKFQTEFRHLMCKKGLLLIGPSGAGKTTLAKALSTYDCSYSIVRNTTTRKPRRSDVPGHFDYITESEFQERVLSGDFMFARTGEPPYYGYTHEAILTSSQDERQIVFMFRSSGLELFVREAFAPLVIVMNGQSSDVRAHSEDETDHQPNENSIAKQMKVNNELSSMLDQKKVLYFYNGYSGVSEISALVDAIKASVSYR